jgi:hypothetical protein
LRLEGDKITILQDDNSKTKPNWQPLREGARLFTEVGPSATAPIRLGHIYVLRIADTKDKSHQVVKLMVIGYRPEESVTLRWELL